jgi:hypothetical protein
VALLAGITIASLLKKLEHEASVRLSKRIAVAAEAAYQDKLKPAESIRVVSQPWFEARSVWGRVVRHLNVEVQAQPYGTGPRSLGMLTMSSGERRILLTQVWVYIFWNESEGADYFLPWLVAIFALAYGADFVVGAGFSCRRVHPVIR